MGMFDKTLDAAISKSSEIDSSFDSLDLRVEEAKQLIIDEAVSELGQAGIKEQEKIASIVNNQLSRLEDKISSTRTLTESYLSKNERLYPIDSKLNKSIINLLLKSKSPLSMKEISLSMPIAYTTLKKSVNNLINQGVIDMVTSENKTAMYAISEQYAA